MIMETSKNITSARIANDPTHEMSQRKTIIRIWLNLCSILVLAIIVVGAITRLTESGLSIVEWRLVTGTLPPLNEAAWLEEFLAYKTSPEFQKKNFWMNVQDFKTIYFWEWLHRLIGRVIGLAYALPFLFFLVRGWLPKGRRVKYASLVTLVAAQGLMGWLMVKSGLIDQPAVSHYRLAAHLGLALLLLSMTHWHALNLSTSKQQNDKPEKTLFFLALIGTFLLCVTILWGAFTAGLDAGLIYNETFPLMGNALVPEEVHSAATLSYALTETHAGVQFAHRWLAMLTGLYLLLYSVFSIVVKKRTHPLYPTIAVTVVIQISLGITTLFSGVALIPAVLHQTGAVILLLLMVRSLYANRLQPQNGRND